MNSTATSQLKIIFICIYFLIVFVSYISSEPNILLTKMKKYSDDDHSLNSIWIRPILYDDLDEWNNEENNSNELSKYILDNDENTNSRASLTSPIRRSNFWKRSNFWRKRANFWRRDSST